MTSKYPQHNQYFVNSSNKIPRKNERKKCNSLDYTSIIKARPFKFDYQLMFNKTFFNLDNFSLFDSNIYSTLFNNPNTNTITINNNNRLPFPPHHFLNALYIILEQPIYLERLFKPHHDLNDQNNKLTYWIYLFHHNHWQKHLINLDLTNLTNLITSFSSSSSTSSFISSNPFTKPKESPIPLDDAAILATIPTTLYPYLWLYMLYQAYTAITITTTHVPCEHPPPPLSLPLPPQQQQQQPTQDSVLDVIKTLTGTYYDDYAHTQTNPNDLIERIIFSLQAKYLVLAMKSSTTATATATTTTPAITSSKEPKQAFAVLDLKRLSSNKTYHVKIRDLTGMMKGLGEPGIVFDQPTSTNIEGKSSSSSWSESVAWLPLAYYTQVFENTICVYTRNDPNWHYYSVEIPQDEVLNPMPTTLTTLRLMHITAHESSQTILGISYKGDCCSSSCCSSFEKSNRNETTNTTPNQDLHIGGYPYSRIILAKYTENGKLTYCGGNDGSKRDLRLECTLAKGQYLLFVESHWKENHPRSIILSCWVNTTHANKGTKSTANIIGTGNNINTSIASIQATTTAAIEITRINSSLALDPIHLGKLHNDLLQTIILDMLVSNKDEEKEESKEQEQEHKKEKEKEKEKEQGRSIHTNSSNPNTLNRNLHDDNNGNDDILIKRIGTKHGLAYFLFKNNSTSIISRYQITLRNSKDIELCKTSDSCDITNPSNFVLSIPTQTQRLVIYRALTQDHELDYAVMMMKTNIKTMTMTRNSPKGNQTITLATGNSWLTKLLQADSTLLPLDKTYCTSLHPCSFGLGPSLVPIPSSKLTKPGGIAENPTKEGLIPSSSQSYSRLLFKDLASPGARGGSGIDLTPFEEYGFFQSDRPGLWLSLPYGGSGGGGGGGGGGSDKRFKAMNNLAKIIKRTKYLAFSRIIKAAYGPIIAMVHMVNKSLVKNQLQYVWDVLRTWSLKQEVKKPRNKSLKDKLHSYFSSMKRKIFTRENSPETFQLTSPSSDTKSQTDRLAKKPISPNHHQNILHEQCLHQIFRIMKGYILRLYTKVFSSIYERAYGIPWPKLNSTEKLSPKLTDKALKKAAWDELFHTPKKGLKTPRKPNEPEQNELSGEKLDDSSPLNTRETMPDMQEDKPNVHGSPSNTHGNPPNTIDNPPRMYDNPPSMHDSQPSTHDNPPSTHDSPSSTHDNLPSMHNSMPNTHSNPLSTHDNLLNLPNPAHPSTQRSILPNSDDSLPDTKNSSHPNTSPEPMMFIFPKDLKPMPPPSLVEDPDKQGLKPNDDKTSLINKTLSFLKAPSKSKAIQSTNTITKGPITLNKGPSTLAKGPITFTKPPTTPNKASFTLNKGQDDQPPIQKPFPEAISPEVSDWASKDLLSNPLESQAHGDSDTPNASMTNGLITPINTTIITTTPMTIPTKKLDSKSIVANSNSLIYKIWSNSVKKTQTNNTSVDSNIQTLKYRMSTTESNKTYDITMTGNIAEKISANHPGHNSPCESFVSKVKNQEKSPTNQIRGSSSQPIIMNSQLGGSLNQPIGSSKQPIGSFRQPIGSSRQLEGSHTQPLGSFSKPIGSSQSIGTPNQSIDLFNQLIGPSSQLMGPSSQQTGPSSQSIGSSSQSRGSSAQPLSLSTQLLSSSSQPLGSFSQALLAHSTSIAAKYFSPKRTERTKDFTKNHAAIAWSSASKPLHPSVSPQHQHPQHSQNPQHPTPFASPTRESFLTPTITKELLLPESSNPKPTSITTTITSSSSTNTATMTTGAGPNRASGGNGAAPKRKPHPSSTSKPTRTKSKPRPSTKPIPTTPLSDKQAQIFNIYLQKNTLSPIISSSTHSSISIPDSIATSRINNTNNKAQIEHLVKICTSHFVNILKKTLILKPYRVGFNFLMKFKNMQKQAEQYAEIMMKKQKMTCLVMMIWKIMTLKRKINLVNGFNVIKNQSLRCLDIEKKVKTCKNAWEIAVMIGRLRNKVYSWGFRMIVGYAMQSHHQQQQQQQQQNNTTNTKTSDDNNSMLLSMLNILKNKTHSEESIIDLIMKHMDKSQCSMLTMSSSLNNPSAAKKPKTITIPELALSNIVKGETLSTRINSSTTRNNNNSSRDLFKSGALGIGTLANGTLGSSTLSGALNSNGGTSCKLVQRVRSPHGSCNQIQLEQSIIYTHQSPISDIKGDFISNGSLKRNSQVNKFKASVN